jgi:dTDP-4-dehydrorhamnose reductase
MILDHRPHWIVHCGPLCASSWDAPAEAPSARDGGRTARRLALLAAEAGSRLTILSTDAVFAGPRMFHAETDPALDQGPGARAALGLEQAVRDSDALVVRTHAFGWSPAGIKSGFAERLWQRVREGASCPASPHCHATPILATDLAELLWLAYRRRLAGLYHIAGAERTSQRRFAAELAAAFGLAQAPSPMLEGPFDSSEARETSLDTRRARRGLQRGMPMLRDGLERFAQQAVNGFRARLQSPSPLPAREAA